MYRFDTVVCGRGTVRYRTGKMIFSPMHIDQTGASPKATNSNVKANLRHSIFQTYVRKNIF